MDLKNKKGNMGMAIVLCIFIFIIGMTVVNLIMPDVDSFRIGMSCSDAANISDGTKLTCLLGDLTIPYFIVLVVSIAGGFILEKVII